MRTGKGGTAIFRVLGANLAGLVQELYSRRQGDPGLTMAEGVGDGGTAKWPASLICAFFLGMFASTAFRQLTVTCMAKGLVTRLASCARHALHR